MLPRVILHNIVSVDGRIDWFTPDIDQYHRLAATWNEDATLAGADTLLASEDPKRVAEAEASPVPKAIPNDIRPVLAVVDSRGRISNWNYWRMQPFWKDLVVLCSETTPEAHIQRLEEARVSYLQAGQGYVDLRLALERLDSVFGVKTVRVESGGTLNGALLRAGLVDEISILTSPCLIGGICQGGIFKAPDLDTPNQITNLSVISAERLEGDVVWLRYQVNK